MVEMDWFWRLLKRIEKEEMLRGGGGECEEWRGAERVSEKKRMAIDGRQQQWKKSVLCMGKKSKQEMIIIIKSNYYKSRRNTKGRWKGRKMRMF